ncbi:MAG: hypothetical protein IJQ67_00180 [Bacilli bacterium]|nr:hypothetical protein [Bacilli bacterium]
MNQTGYLILSISILVILLAVFIVSFILYKRTPLPKGCEKLKISEENCSACQNKGCEFYQKKDEEE